MFAKWETLSASALIVGLLLSAPASAQDIETVLFFDDFESADPVGTLLPDSPPIGEDWRFFNPNTTDSSIAANPSSETRNTSSKVYHMVRPESTPAVTTLIAPLSKQNQDLIIGNGSATIEFKFYGVGAYGISLIANDAPVGTIPTGFAATGLGLNSGLIQYTGHGTSPGGYTMGDWHDVRLDLDFESQQYTVTIDEEVDTFTPAPFDDPDVETITNVWIGNFFRPADWYFDNFRVSTTGPAPPDTREWALEGTGVWTAVSNWSPKFAPNGSDHVASFGSAITAPSTVILDEAVTVSGIAFDNANTYAVAGTGSITLDGASPVVTVNSGDHQIQVEVNLAADATVNATGGSIDFNNQIDLAGNTLTTTGAVNINHSVINSGGAGAIVNGGSLSTLGTTSIAGDLISTGSLDIMLESTGEKVMFNVIGSANLEGLVYVDVPDGFTPTGDLTILTATEGIQLTGDLVLGGAAAGLFTGLSVVDNSLMLSAVAVPEPSAIALALVGALVGFAPRRSSSRKIQILANRAL